MMSSPDSYFVSEVFKIVYSVLFIITRIMYNFKILLILVKEFKFYPNLMVLILGMSLGITVIIVAV
jgi:hypothetical protein